MSGTADETYFVLVQPLDIVLNCRAGETLIRCAWRHGYYWPTICGGTGDCGSCRCEIIEGENNLSQLEPTERLLFQAHPELKRSDRLVRLACCTTVKGPITLFKKGVEPKG